MAILDDTTLQADPGNIEIVRPVGRRRITHVIHDIDGTHSLIRDWPPVMSLTIHWAINCGLGEDFDSQQNREKLISQVGSQPLAETDRFCIESAGLSALTQMEYGIRRAIELGNAPPDAGLSLSEQQHRNNSQIIQRMWQGQERFDDISEPEVLRAFIAERTPRLFRLYEAILNGASRDRNTAAAWKDPQSWRVPGSYEFVTYLQEIGCINYFVTGAVIYEDGGMYEEVKALGFKIGPGQMVEALHGSSWDRKLPKDEVMKELCERENMDPATILVVGDGRSEIHAGARMGCVVMSRLAAEATRQRQLHKELGTNYILPDYTHPALKRLIRQGNGDGV
ncbi:MAG TPA: HAD family hydrolase [Phycisphaerae bacterium]|nr:HAD family hydrolase [Phycisphaerae bacterium]